MVFTPITSMSVGGEMESSLRKTRQTEGITMAKLQQKYSRRHTGATENREKRLESKTYCKHQWQKY